MDNLYYAFIILCFFAGAIFFEGLYLAWNAARGPGARRIARRLEAISAGSEGAVSTALVKKRLLSDVPVIEKLLLEIPRIHSLDRFLFQSGMELTVAGFIGITVTVAVAGAAVAMLLKLPAIAVAASALAPAAAWVLLIQSRRVRRMRALERQLPDALDLMARAMQAGHAFLSALHIVGTEGSQPISGEFQTTFDEINFGMPSEQALSHLAARVASNDLRYFVVAVLIQRETGGNLAEILTSIAMLIRERQKFEAKVRVLSAEGRLSAWTLIVLPFALAATIMVINPGFLAQLWTDPMGVRMASTALVLMAVGAWWIWRMVKIRI